MWYYSLNEYLQKEFGEKLYKIALSGGMSCPNRDGTIGDKGCIFCSSSGSGEFAEPLQNSVDLQIENAKKRIRSKTNAKHFIAYFQDYTNTYAPLETLERLFRTVIEREDISVLDIATRPDCLPDDVLSLLHELSLIKPVWIELGLQTANENTARYIRRGYPNTVFLDAAEKLNRYGIRVIAHQIIGLPGENMEDYLATAEMIAQSGAFGIKLHLLHVLRGTDLAEDYEKGRFRTLEKEEYINIVSDLLEYLPPYIVIHRLTGDGAKRDLIAPEWSADKKDVLNSMRRIFLLRDTTQGRKCRLSR